MNYILSYILIVWIFGGLIQGVFVCRKLMETDKVFILIVLIVFAPVVSLLLFIQGLHFILKGLLTWKK